MKTILRMIYARVLCLLVLLFAPAFAFAQSAPPPPFVFAESYAQWNFGSQTPNSYIFSGTNCLVTPLTGAGSGVSAPFFAFGPTATPFPVYIRDDSPALSEVVTPLSTSRQGSSCGFVASTSNSHITFNVLSGTAGLQEAVASQASQASAVVYLDQYWYGLVAALPGSQTAPAIIAALKGGGNVILKDLTTAPTTDYVWSGTAFKAISGSTAGKTLPTAALGAAAGTAPSAVTTYGSANVTVVSFTAGTSTTTGTIFTLTWPTTNSFTYPPTCTVTSTGANQYLTGTVATTYSASHAILTFTEATAALTASTAYQFTVRCN